MPRRVIPFVNTEIYHVCNRGISLIPVFISKRDYRRAIDVLNYYQFAKVHLSFSKFKRLSLPERTIFLDRLNKTGNRLVKILCYCLMPNHFHLLLLQVENGGISKLIANFQNSYTRYFNLQNRRIGPLLQGAFKAVRIESDEQLLHVARYIHLNPYSSLITKTIDGLKRYPWSSLNEYLNPQQRTISFSDKILSFFKSVQEYEKFVFDQANYQRELEKIKHLVFE